MKPRGVDVWLLPERSIQLMALYPAMGTDLVGIHDQLDISEKSRIDVAQFTLTADIEIARVVDEAEVPCQWRGRHYTFDHLTNNMHAAGLIGRIAGTLTGTPTITGGTYVFDGNYGLNPGTYDANPLNRPHYQEALTSLLQAISDAVGTTNYQINFTGRDTVHFQGSRP